MIITSKLIRIEEITLAILKKEYSEGGRTYGT